MKYTTRYFFNDKSLCVFTDASFESADSFTTKGISSAGCNVYRNTQLVKADCALLYDSDAQQGELYALYLGIIHAQHYLKKCPDISHVHVFSDSLNSVLAVRERIFDWMKQYQEGKSMFGPNGRVKNNDWILKIVNAIQCGNVPMNIYHVKGHVGKESAERRDYAKKTFQESNGLEKDVIDMNLVLRLADCNNVIDQYSRQMLTEKKADRTVHVSTWSYPDYTDPKLFDLSLYRSLVNRTGCDKVAKKENVQEVDTWIQCSIKGD